MLALFRVWRKRLPKFKFSPKFPMGFHVILQLQITKSKPDWIRCANLFQPKIRRGATLHLSRNNSKWALFLNYTVIRMPLKVGCCHRKLPNWIELFRHSPPPIVIGLTFYRMGLVHIFHAKQYGILKFVIWKGDLIKKIQPRPDKHDKCFWTCSFRLH